MKEEHQHDLQPVLCLSCKTHLQAHEEYIELLGQWLEIAGFCPNESCIRYNLLAR